MDSNGRWLRIQELADLLGVRRSSIYSWCRERRELPGGILRVKFAPRLVRYWVPAWLFDPRGAGQPPAAAGQDQEAA